uniref:Uncharacterized protein n=1 Tax=Pristionchus pacificus TaxID=54126 RepID=A0A2A6CWV7_PRIPA|eukprot:PDM82566.1 hypothetical protein PRIPAC_36959 [Pristionchus pacificus]
MPHLSEVVVALFTISLFILDHLVASMTKQRRTTTMHDRIMPEINFYNHKINFRPREYEPQDFAANQIKMCNPEVNHPDIFIYDEKLNKQGDEITERHSTDTKDETKKQLTEWRGSLPELEQHDLLETAVERHRVTPGRGKGAKVPYEQAPKTSDVVLDIKVMK